MTQYEIILYFENLKDKSRFVTENEIIRMFGKKTGLFYIKEALSKLVDSKYLIKKNKGYRCKRYENI